MLRVLDPHYRKRAINEPQKVQMTKLENDIIGLVVTRCKGCPYGDR